ncbi:MAG: response regulator [Archangium sp.]
MNLQRKVLVVDDEAGLRTTLAANLELEGLEVCEASTAEAALEQLRTQHFDLIVSDIRMPGMTGVDLFRRVRDEQPGVPMLLMTAFAQEELVDGAMGDGVFAILDKPFDVQHALDVIWRALEAPAVLVVDDSVTARATVAALKSRGLQAIAVSQSDEALHALENQLVDVCVLDVALPGLDAAAVLKELRVREPTMRVIALTSTMKLGDAPRLSTLGVTSFMRKPVTLPALARGIARARASRS